MLSSMVLTVASSLKSLLMPSVCLPARAGSWATSSRRLHGTRLPVRPNTTHHHTILYDLILEGQCGPKYIDFDPDPQFWPITKITQILRRNKFVCKTKRKMTLEEIFNHLSLWMLNFCLQPVVSKLSFCLTVWIHKVAEYRSNLGPDPEHCFWWY